MSPTQPSQAQLFALYMKQCCDLRIKKPNKHIVRLLGDEIDGAQPLALCAAIEGMHNLALIGSRGLMALLSIVAECHCIKLLDISAIQDVFIADPYKEAPSGNDVISLVADCVAQHPSIEDVDLRGHSVGTVAATFLLAAVKQNGRIQSLLFDEAGIARHVVDQIRAQLTTNAQGRNPSRPQPPLGISDHIRAVQFVDRKTSAQRQALSVLLESLGFLSGNVIEAAAAVPLGEVLHMVSGLRGDGKHVFLIEQGVILVSFGSTELRLGRGDFFGEPFRDPLFSAGLLSVADRGTAFRIPLSLIEQETAKWCDGIAAHLPTLRKAPLLQPLHMWTICRLCQLGQVKTVEAGAVLLEPRSIFDGLYIVLSGQLHVTDASGKGDRVLTAGDLCGHEAGLSSHRLSTKRVLASSTASCRVLMIDPQTALRLVIGVLRDSLAADLRSLSM